VSLTINHELARDIARRQAIADALAERPGSMQSHYQVAAIGEQLAEQGEMHLAALSAGARSPFHVESPAPDNRPHRTQIFVESGAVVEGQTEAETEALGQDYSPEPADLHPTVTEAELEALAFRESEFVRHSRNRSGELLSLDATAKRDEARALINKQTRDLALALVSEGIPAFLPETAPKASIVCPFTGQRLDPLPVRRVNFFPSVAQQRRSGMLTHLEAFLERYPYTQLTTFTRGPRLIVHDAEELREGLGAFHRRLSILAKSPFCKAYGFEIVFSATELGTVEPLAEGGLSVHIHAHTFARFKEVLGSVRTAEFNSKMWQEWGAQWDVGTSVNKAREACKYPVKPSDLERLSNEQVALLFNGLRGMKLVRPLGELRATIRDRVKAAIKGRRWKTVKDKETALELRFRPDWNAQPRVKKKAKKRLLKLSAVPVYAWKKIIERTLAKISDAISDRRRALRAIVARRQQVLAGFLRRHAGFEIKRRAEAVKSKKKARLLNAGLFLFFWFTSERSTDAIRAARAKAAAAKHLRKPIQNQIVARLAAAAYFDRVSRPALLVWNYDGNLAALTGHKFVAEVVAAVEAQVEAARAAIPAKDEADKRAKIQAAEIDAESAMAGFRGITRVHTSHTTGLAKKSENEVRK